MESFVATSIVLSAFTYLFDFASNLVLFVDYGKHYFHFLKLERNKLCDDRCRNQTSELAGYFWGILGVLFLSHTLNALIFKFEVHKQDDPFKAAYFLPLIHLCRLISLLWNSMSYGNFKKFTQALEIVLLLFQCRICNLRSPEANGLFCILGTTLECMPILILQFSAYLVLVKASIVDNTPIIFKTSVAASLLSAAYNGGSSVQSITVNASGLWTTLQVITSTGLFTLFAGMIRCLTYVNIIVHIRDYFQRNRAARSRAKYHLSDLIPIAFLVTSIGSYWLFYWLLQYPKQFHQRLHNRKKLLICLVFAYMSIIVGPLYPMVNEAREMNELGTYRFRRRLFIVAVVNILIDLMVMGVTYWLKTLAREYLLVFGFATLSYFASIGWYIRIDAQCGPPDAACQDNNDNSAYFSTRSSFAVEL